MYFDWLRLELGDGALWRWSLTLSYFFQGTPIWGRWWCWWGTYMMTKTMMLVRVMMIFPTSEDDWDDDDDDVEASREWLSLQSDFYPENGWTAEVYSETVNTVIIHLTTFITVISSWQVLSALLLSPGYTWAGQPRRPGEHRSAHFRVPQTKRRGHLERGRQHCYWYECKI